MRALLLSSVTFLYSTSMTLAAEPALSVATFQVDATPPLGSPLCMSFVEPVKEIIDPLSARGVVILSDQPPIVLCALDWVATANGGYEAWRIALADAAGTTPDRVAVHCLHQHDAPGIDFDAEELLASRGLSGAMFHVAFARQTIDRAASAVREAIPGARPISHVGVGQAKVERVGSNRRILGEDGRVQYIRYSSSTIPEAIAAPEGTIDPLVRLVALFDGDTPIVSLTYYATHPQSFYGEGGVSADFVGMARSTREQAVPKVAHIHFDGAGGNVAAGKYNDGTHPRRLELASRLAEGMKAAWESHERTPVSATDLSWRTRDVELPISQSMDEQTLTDLLDNSNAAIRDRVRAAIDLAWLKRVQAGQSITLSCLRLGPVDILHMPGELFVEYQLAAAAIRPDRAVCMAAYGDVGPGYIGTQVAYGQGGYETSYVSHVAPEVEDVLMKAIEELLE